MQDGAGGRRCWVRKNVWKLDSRVLYTESLDKGPVGLVYVTQ